MTQRGFSSVLLIVIIVTLAGLSAFAMRFVSQAQGAATAQLQTIRVQHAAEAAIEWQRYRLLKRNPAPTGCVATINITVPSGSGNIPVTVTCVQTPLAAHSGGVPPAVKTFNTFAFTARACWPAGPGGVCPNPAPPADYVERQLAGSGACQTAGASCTW